TDRRSNQWGMIIMTKSRSQMSLRARQIRGRMARLAMPVTALVAVSVLVAACGSAKQPAAQPSSTTPTQSTSTSTAPPGTTSATPPVRTTPSCATSDLKTWLARDPAGGAMGSFYYLIEFKNVSDRVCVLRGYPGVSAYAAGHQVGSSADRQASAEPTVTLQPGATAHSLLRLANVGAYPPETCGQVSATSLKVYPPNQTVAASVAYRFGACSVTAVRFLQVWPVQAGLTRSDTPPATISRPMKQLAIHFGTGTWRATVTVTVPRTWQVAGTQPRSCCQQPPTVCVVEAGSDYAGNLANCRLTVTYAPAFGGLISPNEPPQGTACRSSFTTQESSWTLGGRQGEYRRFVDRCSGRAFEQWTIMTAPQVAFWHPITQQSDHAVLAAIVDSASLPPQTDPRRQSDVGYVRQISKQANGYHLRLDRVVPNLDGSVTNLNPATYVYRLDGLVAIPKSTPVSCEQWGNLSCNLAFLLRQFAKGPHPADGSLAVCGAYVYVAAEAGGYRVEFSR
ncbi:MAG TPA: DUF4232 domain-containing protein, partial [Mycobacterium sp.]|nr:DUF4232 domain-containing protein [Mycobacterium sp.]